MDAGMTEYLYLVFRLLALAQRMLWAASVAEPLRAAALAAVELFVGLGATTAPCTLGGLVVDWIFALRTRQA
jgi:hypothetical protein